jgi:hypothetical protein
MDALETETLSLVARMQTAGMAFIHLLRKGMVTQTRMLPLLPPGLSACQPTQGLTNLNRGAPSRTSNANGKQILLRPSRVVTRIEPGSVHEEM